MWEYEHQVETSASPAALWRLWADVPGWASWNAGVASAGIDGPFAPGTAFTMVPPEGEPIRMTLTEVVPGERLAYSWKGGHEDNVGYGSRLDTIVTFTLEETEGGTRLRVVHSGFVLPRNETAYRNMSGGWSQVIGRIGAVTEEEASSRAQ